MLRYGREFRQVAAVVLLACFAGTGRAQNDVGTAAANVPRAGQAPPVRSSSVVHSKHRTVAANGKESARAGVKPQAANGGLTAGYIYALAGALAKSNASTFPGGNMTFPSAQGGLAGGDGNYLPTDDGAAAYLAGLLPAGVAVDASGNLYIADLGNDMIREVPASANPVINRLLGSVWTENTGAPPWSGALENSCGNLLVGGSTTTCNLNGQALALAGDLYDANFNLLGAATTFPQDVKVDGNGNVYFFDSGDQVLEVLYQAGTVPGLTSPQVGYVYTLAGTLDTPTISPPLNTSGASGGTGEGGPGTSATFGGVNFASSTYNQGNGNPQGPEGFFVDPAGNVYIADTFNNLVRVLYEGGAVPPVLTAEGIAVNPATDAGNIYTIAGSYVLGTTTNLNACGYQDSNIAPSNCGEGLLATSAWLSSPGGVYVDANGNVFIADTGDNLVRAIYVGGAGLFGAIANPVPGNLYTIVGDVADVAAMPITIPPPLPADQPVTYAANACVTTRLNNCGDGGPALAAFLYNPSSLTEDSSGNLYISDSGDQVVRVLYQSGQLAGLTGPLVANNLYTYAGQIAGAGADYMSVVNNFTPNACDVTVPDTVCGNGGPAVAAQLYFPAGLAFDSQNNLYIADWYDGAVREVAGMPPAQAQTITFPSSGTLPTSVVYGNAPIALNATASSGLPVTFTVTGAGHLAGSTAVVDSVGTITITANQAGNAAYLPAPAVTVEIQVTPAVLTVTGSTIDIPVGSAIPSYANDYTITGFVYGQSQTSATSGAPNVTSTYTPATPVNTTLPLVVTQGTLAATPPNYTFTLKNGTVTVTGGATQTITFPAIPNQTYGAPPIALNAIASSGLPITYTVSAGAPVTLSGALLTITGVAASVTITASQPGNGTYAPATSVSRTFAIGPAPLTLTANNISVIENGVIPPLTYSITGFVNGDTQTSAASGQPALSTVPSSSPLGTYPITITAGTFVAPNYSPIFVNGTLTIVAPTPQSINFTTPPAQVIYGVTNIPLAATASSGLPVTLTVVSGPGVIVAGPALQVIGAGTITVTASQAGNSVYGPAPSVNQTITVNPAVLTVTATSYTVALGVAPPSPLGYSITGLVNGDSPQVVGGFPVVTATSYQGPSESLPGVYPITITLGTLAATNYSFNLVGGTITVLFGPPPDFSITSSPTTVTLAPGQVQAVTVLALPINGYDNPYSASAGTGGISFSCTNLPANVTCTFSPTVVSVNGSDTLIGPSPTGATTTLTISASSAALAAMRSPDSRNGVLPAAIFLLPGGLAAAFLGFSRKRFAHNTRMRQWLVMICLLAGVMGMGACGYSNTLNTSGFAKPGTTTIAVEAVGAPANSATGATGTITHSINLTVTVQ